MKKLGSSDWRHKLRNIYSEGERMTLITAWPTKDGLVIHADSQETIGKYRREVETFERLSVGECEVIIAGAGRSTLVESLPLVFKKRITNACSIGEFESAAEEALAHFYQHDVQLHPADGKEKEVRFFIGASHKPSGEYGAWITQNIRLQRLSANKPLIFGCEHELYWLTAERLFSEGMSTAQAVLTGLYLFTIAERTSNYIKGPFSVAVMQGNGIHVADESCVRQATEWLEAYELRVKELFFACADTSIPVYRLEDHIAAVSQVALHGQQAVRTWWWLREAAQSDATKGG